MTFSICVREEFTDRGSAASAPGAGADGPEHRRFGVAVTTRLPAVGALSPFASESAAVAVQSHVDPDLGRRAVAYADEGLGVDDALAALLDADDARESRQVHGVGADATFAFSGEACREWWGHREGGNYTVAGNLLVGESVVDAVADAYESGDRSEPLAKRLVDALAAGYAEGGDRRDDLDVQSAALRVVSTRDAPHEPYYNDLRVDATETPIRDLRGTYRDAKRGYRAALEKYADEGTADGASAGDRA